MFARIRPSCSASLRQCARRALATEGQSISTELPPPLDSFPPVPEADRHADQQKAPAFDEDKAGIIVRPWDGIQSMPEVFSLIRGIERKYGKIREYSISRDYDFRSQYAPFFWARFEDPASYERVRDAKRITQLEVPVVDTDRPGNVGLDDLQDLLLSEDWQGPEEQELAVGEVEGQVKTRTVDVKIEFSKFGFYLTSVKPDKTSNGAFQQAYRSWGGFFQPTPDTPPEATHWMRQVKGNSTRRPRQVEESPAETHKVDSFGSPQQLEGHVGHEFDTQAEADNLAFTRSAARAPPAKPATPPPEQPAATSSSWSDPVQSASVIPPTVETVPPVVETSVPHTAEKTEEPRAPPQLSRRERILAQARENARTPLPSQAQKAEQAKLEEAEKKKKAERTMLSVRERLWKIMGEKWF
ncbi:hypothetical protein SCP_0305850 [Sparassis crispa]|uniref:Uncharacterized protein n=1 Tax=Sparassis crispa TaxID=139825 RepID=A0A401GFG1_9APHY|nr:hypothetical protein SCP_0305850 [Sparassis crispa]GBE80865.1 hypothetical protein SCP_0305850 [Sparassis crispa]